MPGALTAHPDPWSNPADRARAFAECAAAYETLLAGLASRLDEIHGEKHSLRYWRIVLGPWLMRFVQILRDRHELALRAPGDATPAPERVVPRDALDFIVRVHGDAHNFQLLAALASPSAPSVVSAPPRASGSSTISRTAAALAGRPVLLSDLGIPALDEAALCLETGLAAWPLRFRDPGLPPPPLDPALRDRLKGLPTQTTFEKAAAAVLPGEFPWLHLEGRRDFEAAVGAAALRAPRVLVSTDGWTYNEAFKSAAASFAERGTRLVAVQHGGGYGLYARIWQEDLERAASDSYWCWGWASLEADVRLRDVPSPMLSFRSDDGSPGESAVLVAYEQPRWRYGFQSQAQSETFGAYLDDRDAFLSALGPDRARFTVRLAKQDMGWGQRERLASAFPDATLEAAAGPLHERLRRAALTIIDHPATSLIEAFALDRPVLLFWRPDVWDARPSAVPLLDGLRRAGILYDDPLSAARAATSAMKDPRAWWARPEARAAAAAFRQKLALGAPDWRGRWAAALRAELAAAQARA